MIQTATQSLLESYQKHNQKEGINLKEIYYKEWLLGQFIRNLQENYLGWLHKMCLMIIVLICSCSNDLTSLGKHRNKDKPTLDSHLDNIDFIDNCTGAAVTAYMTTFVTSKQGDLPICQN